MNTLISVIGPTASGKSSVAIRLAKKLKTVVLSADARQIYKGMDIGTAKIRPDEMQGVPHYLLDICSPDEYFSAGKFMEACDNSLKKLFTEYSTLILAGGSGLYLKAVWEGLDDMPKVPKEVRDKVNEDLESKGLSFLLDELKECDPETYSVIDKMNPRRVTRAVEFFRGTGKPISSFRKKEMKNDSICHIKIGLNVPREKLFERINQRVDEMISDGLVEEVKKLVAQYGMKQPGFETVGYAEIIQHLEGNLTLEQAVEKIKQNTRHYAKRQMTWFRKSEDIRWFDPGDYDSIESSIINELKNAESAEAV